MSCELIYYSYSLLYVIMITIYDYSNRPITTNRVTDIVLLFFFLCSIRYILNGRRSRVL
jgi:hypothetical protein